MAGEDTLRVMLYEEYDSVMHGNQTYIAMLMREFAHPESTIDLSLVTAHRGALYDAASAHGQTEALGISRWPARVIALIGNIKRAAPDLIVCHNERSLLTAAMAAMVNRVPLVWYIKNTRASLITDLPSFVAADKVLYIAPECIHTKGALLNRIFGHKAAELPIGVRLESFTDIPLPSDHDRPLRVLMVAALVPAKGADIALKAIRTFKERGVEVELRLAGGVPAGNSRYADDLLKAAHGLNVTWLGWTGEIKKELQWADVVILPSRSEGVPRSIVEAMAAGRPCVATSVGGTPSVIEHGSTGFIIGPDDPEALAERLRELASDFSLRLKMAEAGRRRAIEKFSFDVHLEALKKIWHQCAKKRA